MTPILFGDSASPLFGVLHEPAADAAQGQGVLVCPPIGQEHVRTHWALRQVGITLARAGYHVLRFDWFGVGDSTGDLAEASVARWTDDAITAAKELRRAAGIRKLSVVGLRFGATLATLAARKIKPTTLVLWDPVTSGAAYVTDLQALHGRLIADPLRFWSRWPQNVRATLGRFVPSVAPARSRGRDEFVGFRYGEALRKELASIDAQALTDVGSARVVVIDSDPRKELGAFTARLSERGARVERKPTDVRGRWDDVRQIEELLLPADAVRLISEALEGRAA